MSSGQDILNQHKLTDLHGNVITDQVYRAMLEERARRDLAEARAREEETRRLERERLEQEAKARREEEARLRDMDDFISNLKRNQYAAMSDIAILCNLDMNKYDSRGLAPIHHLALCEVSDEVFDFVYDKTGAENLLMVVNPAVYKEDATGALDDIRNGDTVLHLAAKNSNKKITQKFCQKFNAYQDVQNHDGETPLKTAAKIANMDMVKFSILNGATVTPEIADLMARDSVDRDAADKLSDDGVASPLYKRGKNLEGAAASRRRSEHSDSITDDSDDDRDSPSPLCKEATAQQTARTSAKRKIFLRK